MKLQILFALTLGLLGSVSATAQENNRSATDSKTEKKVVIIKKYRDANGEERTEKIVKEGDDIGNLPELQNIEGLDLLNDFEIEGMEKLLQRPNCAAREIPKGGFLGVVLGDNTTSGVVITDVEPETAAQKADIQAGDIIISINGKRVRTAEELRAEMSLLKPNDKAKIGILRDLDKITKNVTLGAYTEPTLHRGGRCEGNGKHPHRKIEKKKIIIDTDEPSVEKKVIIGDINDLDLLDDKMGTELKGFQVFPNPSTGSFSIKADLGQSGLRTTISVSDVNGKELIREEVAGQKGVFEKQYDLSKQAKGTYLVKVQQGGMVLVEKIILQN